MDENLLKSIKSYIEHETGGQYEDEDASFTEGAEALKTVLNDGKATYGEDVYNVIFGEISQYADADEVQQRKLYNYCQNFVDPYPQQNAVPESYGSESYSVNGTVVECHRFLSRDKLAQVCEFIRHHKKDKTVGQVVNQLMFEHNLTAPQVYDEAMLSRQDFSRIVNSNKGISKLKIWSLIIGLHCNMDEADMVLYSAGYVRKLNETDLTLTYFIRHQNYDILAINEVLYSLGLKLLSVYTEVRDEDSHPDKKRSKKKS